MRPNPKASTGEEHEIDPDDGRSTSPEDEDLESEPLESPKDVSKPKTRTSTSDPVPPAAGRKSSGFRFSHEANASHWQSRNLRQDRRYSPSTETSSGPTSGSLEKLHYFSSDSVAASIESLSRSHLSDDLQYFLEYYENNITSDHYFFKPNAENFLHILLIEQAMQYEPLLYAITGFAAYHMTVRRPAGRVQDFLGYYDRAVSSLRKSLAGGQPHTTGTLLTILQLATFEVRIIVPQESVAGTAEGRINKF